MHTSSYVPLSSRELICEPVAACGGMVTRRGQTQREEVRPGEIAELLLRTEVRPANPSKLALHTYRGARSSCLLLLLCAYIALALAEHFRWHRAPWAHSSSWNIRRCLPNAGGLRMPELSTWRHTTHSSNLHNRSFELLRAGSCRQSTACTSSAPACTSVHPIHQYTC